MANHEDAEEQKRIQVFLAWLEENGALFPKLSWPRNDTDSGIRGVIALDDIPTEDRTMLQIPIHLMMTPVGAAKEPLYGEILKTHTSDILYGDFLLAVYIMIELVKEKDSFYYPYLSILPDPSCLSEWNDDELSLLQDTRISLRAKNKRHFLQTSYDRVVKTLSHNYPELFPLDRFTFQRFTLAWNTIQARAFGRRLPWTALVPFADCLNHSNVQTKYDYNISENGMFRLFPTGNNSYVKGSEVFNSYGRRNNENLLLEYGFAMLDNEWDEVEIGFEFTKSPLSSSPFASQEGDDEYYYDKYHILSYFGYSFAKMFQCSSFYVPLQAFSYLRIVCAPPTLIQRWKDLNEVEAEESDNRSTEQGENRFQDEKQKEVFNPYRSKDSDNRSIYGQSPKSFRNPESYRLFREITSLENEIIIIKGIMKRIIALIEGFTTSIEYDERLYSEAISNSSLSHVRDCFLSEIIYYLQDKFDLNEEEEDLKNDEKGEEVGENSSKSKIQAQLFTLLQKVEGKEDQCIEDDLPLEKKLNIKDERIIKFIRRLTSSPDRFTANAFNALVYRLTRKRIYHQILLNLRVLLQYCQDLSEIGEVHESSKEEEFEISQIETPPEQALILIDDYFNRLTNELTSLKTFPRHTIDQQYIEKLKLYLVQLSEVALKNS